MPQSQEVPLRHPDPAIIHIGEAGVCWVPIRSIDGISHRTQSDRRVEDLLLMASALGGPNAPCYELHQGVGALAEEPAKEQEEEEPPYPLENGTLLHVAKCKAYVGLFS